MLRYVWLGLQKNGVNDATAVYQVLYYIAIIVILCQATNDCLGVYRRLQGSNKKVLEQENENFVAGSKVAASSAQLCFSFLLWKVLKDDNDGDDGDDDDDDNDGDDNDDGAQRQLSFKTRRGCNYSDVLKLSKDKENWLNSLTIINNLKQHVGAWQLRCTGSSLIASYLAELMPE